MIREEFPPWAERVLGSPEKYRTDLADLVKTSLNDKIKFYVSKPDWKLIGFCPSITYFKFRGPKEDLCCRWVIPSSGPQLLYFNEIMGALVVVGNEIPMTKHFSTEEFERDSYLSWCEKFQYSSPGFRSDTKSAILNDIRKYGTGNGNHSKQVENGRKLLAMIGKNDWRFFGIIPTICYMRIKGSDSHLKSRWVHPFGSPGLLYYSFSNDALTCVGTGINFNDSAVNKIPGNKQVLMEGISGPA